MRWLGAAISRVRTSCSIAVRSLGYSDYQVQVDEYAFSGARGHLTKQSEVLGDNSGGDLGLNCRKVSP